MARARRLVVAVDGDLIVERDPQRPSGRLLRQDDMDASYVDLADARHLEFDYLRWARLVLRAHGARHVLHIGGAGCALARALLADDPASRHEVYEIDARVLEIARAHLGLRRQPGLRVRLADGRAALTARAELRSSATSGLGPSGNGTEPVGTGPAGDADAVMVDAFVGARVPRHLVTSEAAQIYRRVAPLVLVNVVESAGWRDARAVAAGLADAYPHVAALGAGRRRGGNVLLLASTTEPDYRRLEAAVAADRAPARLHRFANLSGAAAWRDAGTAPQVLADAE